MTPTHHALDGLLSAMAVLLCAVLVLVLAGCAP